MAARAGTAWWDTTWNPVGGCEPVSPGCKNCYAAQCAATQQTAHQIPLYLGTTSWVKGKPVFNGKLNVLPAGHDGWTKPLTYPGALRPLLGIGEPCLIFVVDEGDLFHQPVAIIDKVVGILDLSPHIGLLLSKRTARMLEYFSAPRSEKTLRLWKSKLWLGFSAERQQEFDERWPQMRPLAAQGWTVFCSIAPMLTPVTLPSDFLAFGNRAWAIVSGEQGKHARYMDPDWARAVRDQCASAGVPFFLLQMTSKQLIPADLYVRQFPAWQRGVGSAAASSQSNSALP